MHHFGNRAAAIDKGGPVGVFAEVAEALEWVWAPDRRITGSDTDHIARLVVDWLVQPPWKTDQQMTAEVHAFFCNRHEKARPRQETHTQRL